ncbi:MAG: DNA translocase FtsK [Bacteroidota bacterium]|nr:DNA translocase FtsK [Bacteroidota bacterium]
MLNEFEYTNRPSVRVTRGGTARSAGYSRVIPMEPDDAAIPEDPEFLYPQELDEVAEPEPAPVRQRRPRGARPMPKRLSEEFEEEEAKAPTTRKRSARAAEAPPAGEQIPLKLRTPAKKPDNTVKQRQVLGVMLILGAILVTLAIISYSPQDTAQAETRFTDLPAVFTRSDPTINANADTAHNWLGLVGAMLANFFINKTIGYASIIFPLFLGWWSLALFKFSTKQRRRLTLATTFMLISAVLFSATIGTTQLINALPHLDREWSGAIGQFLGLTFTRLIGSIGALLIYTTSFIVMLVFAIDLDIELTFRRVKGGYTGLAAKTRMKLIEFWDKREAKKQEKLLRKEQMRTELEEAEEHVPEPEPIIPSPEKVTIKQPEKIIAAAASIASVATEKISAAIKQEPKKEEPAIAEKRSDESEPARDILIRTNGNGQASANGKAAAESSEKISPNAPFLKVRPAPKSNTPNPQPIPRLTKNPDNVLGDKPSGLVRLSGGAYAAPSRSVRILPSDVSAEPEPAPITIKEEPKPAAPERMTAPPVPVAIEEKLPVIEIGNEKILSNEALPHSLDTPSEFASIVIEPKTPAIEKAPATLFGSMEKQVVPENPYNEHLSKYRHPSLDLLTPVSPADEIDTDDEELAKKGTLLRDKLATFGVEIENIVVTPGPVVTLYEFTPAEGVKVSAVGNLTDDIALAMKARGIRIIAPMPGRGTIGIEIPNDHPKMVTMRSVLESHAFANSKMNLPCALGKTISGDVYIDDLSKMPHLLIAGATGSGKSVGVNGIIASLLYAKSPRDVKFVIVDPKKIELSLYKALRNHFLIVSPEAGEEIVTTPQFAVLALKALEIEMEKRYDRLAKAAVRSLADYNLKVSQGKLKSTQEEQHYHLPYIVVIIDELADLMITAGREIEEPICRLAQMARAVGIHLILATQRPSVDVITGVIKANFPARIAYQVATKVDSRTILDSMGAEQLLGNGDMLYLPSGTPKPIRLQAPYISTDEVEAIVEAIAVQQGSGYCYSRPWTLPALRQKGGGTSSGNDDGEYDELFEEAAWCFFRNKQGSTSMLQRRLKIGYSRAARIVDELERVGIIGPADGAKAREVRIESEEELELVLRNLD